MPFETDRILLVDDDYTFCEKMVAGLKEELHDIEIDVVYDGNTAIRIFEQTRYGVVILDMMLPKRSGFLVIEKMKRKSKNVDRPPFIIMVTANEGPRHKEYALSLGTWQYILKPIRMQRLFEYVQEALQKIEAANTQQTS